MSATTLAAFIARCRILCQPRAHVPDAELLRRFTHQRDTDAFGLLLERYASLVWGVCRRVLRSESDREDAFQATFLALVRRPHAIDASQSLGAWLHTVAVRVAHRTRTHSRRLQPHANVGRISNPSPPCTAGDVADEVGSHELFRMVDEEIERLPIAVRAPLVLCCLEGRTRDEAAEALGCSVTAVKSRLQRGRDLLRRRLQRRGVELPAAFLVLGLAGERVRASLWAKTMQSALYTPAPAVAALAETSVSTLAVGKGKLLLAALLLVSSVAGAVGSLMTMTMPESSPAAEASDRAEAEPKKLEVPQDRMDRQGDPLPDGAIARLGTVRFRHGYGVLSVAFSSDGKMVAAGGTGRAVSLWDAATGKELRRFPFHRGQPARAAFSPDGKVLATVSQANSLVCLYDVKTGKELRLLQRHQSGVNCVAFSPDGKFLASGDNQGTVRLWNPAVGNVPPRQPGQPDEELRHVSGDWGEIHTMTFSPDSKILAFAGKDGKIRLWNARTGDEMHRLNGPPKAIYSLSFSPDGKFLASAGQDKTIRLWATATGEQVRVVGEKPDMVLCVAFAPDGRLLASAHRDGTLTVCDPRTGRVIHHWQGHGFAATSVAFSPNGKCLASGSAWDSSVRLWKVNTGTELRAFDAHRASVDLVRWLPGDKTLVSIDRARRVLWWDLPTQRPLRQVALPAPPWSAFALATNGETLATASLQDCSIRLGTIASDKPARLLGKHKKMIQVLALSPDAGLLAAGGRDEALRLWDVRPGREVRQLEGAGKLIWCLAFSPDSKSLAYGVSPIGNKADKMVFRMVDVTNGKEIYNFASNSHVTSVVFSPDGKVLASWHENYPDKSFVCLRDVASGKELRRHSGHPAGTGVISFSPDGKLVASAVGADLITRWIDEKSDPAIHLWEAATGRHIRRFAGHHSGVDSLAFSLDGLKLASGAGDSTILLWDITGRRSDGRWHVKPLTPHELDACWKELMNVDAAKAYDAVWQLVAAPEQAVSFLRKKLPPIPHPDAKAVERWIAGLDSDDFTMRQRATEELRKLGDAIAHSLHRALQGKPSPETRRRVQQLLDQTRDWTPERLRVHRAIQALEHIGNSASREVLQALAAGAPESRLTEEAKASLRRLQQR